MAASLNKVMLIGHLGRDPTIRTGTSGTRVASFSIATSESWRDKASGERKERTEWHNVVVFNDGLVKVVEQYVKKGAKVYVEGQLQTRKWTDKDGADRYSTEIVLQQYRGEIGLLDRSEGSRAPAPDQDSYGSVRSRGAEPPRSMAQQIDDDIPF